MHRKMQVGHRLSPHAGAQVIVGTSDQGGRTTSIQSVSTLGLPSILKIRPFAIEIAPAVLGTNLIGIKSDDYVSTARSAGACNLCRPYAVGSFRSHAH